MNNTNPFIPQGSLLEQKNKKRSRVKLAVFTIFAANILIISPLLIQGCSKKEEPTPDTSALTNTDTNANTVDTNAPALPPMTNAVAQTNTPPPPPPPQPPVVYQPTTKEYVVVKGDSYYTIAKKFGVKMKEVENANPGIAPNKLKVGQKLQIPASGGSSMNASPGTPVNPDTGDTSTYVVKSGDSLTKIAKSNGTTVKAIRAANELKGDKIKVGQKLKIPAKSGAIPETPVNSAPPVPNTALPSTAPLPPAAGAGPRTLINIGLGAG